MSRVTHRHTRASPAMHTAASSKRASCRLRYLAAQHRLRRMLFWPQSSQRASADEHTLEAGSVHPRLALGASRPRAAGPSPERAPPPQPRQLGRRRVRVRRRLRAPLAPERRRPQPRARARRRTRVVRAPPVRAPPVGAPRVVRALRRQLRGRKRGAGPARGGGRERLAVAALRPPEAAEPAAAAAQARHRGVRGGGLRAGKCVRREACRTGCGGECAEAVPAGSQVAAGRGVYKGCSEMALNNGPLEWGQVTEFTAIRWLRALKVEV